MSSWTAPESKRAADHDMVSEDSESSFAESSCQSARCSRDYCAVSEQMSVGEGREGRTRLCQSLDL